ncbi:MAG TPA: hypothetical protein VG434_00265 [Sphingomicrobium sp.]|jgi:bacteriocin-like protein|nr:hypothetical protein [Sphingomicrobium sp.]
MANLEELNADEMNAVTGGGISYTQVDPKTGETVVYSDTGVEIGRFPAGMSLGGSLN